MLNIEERIGLLRDKVQNYIAAGELQLPAHIHAEGLLGGMHEIEKELNSLLNEIVQPE